MKFKIEKTSDRNFKSTVELETIEDLLKYAKENGPLIIWGDDEIEIYDDYRE